MEQAGLFSASLTAFLIESYKGLQPDSGDLTVAGLAQISHQLAAIASNTTFILPSSPSFTPTANSLWCNALWFISLSLSLTCALLATLVEQWAREFLHRTKMRPSPLRRARVFSFLYFGLKHFRMHTIVEAIPFLLHASLLLFFAGLIAFLLPVNHIMMYLMCIVLFVFLVLYAVLTILPLHCKTRDIETSGRFDGHWTPLTDDVELLPFVEAIPDMIYGLNGFRRANDALFDSLLGTIEVASPLTTRINGLISGTNGMALNDPLHVRRCTAAHRAMWALCLMPCAWDRLFDLGQAFFPTGLAGVAASAHLAVAYQAQRWAHNLLRTLRDLLVNPAHSHEEVLPMIQKLMHLLMAHQDRIVIDNPSFFGPTPSDPCSPLFVELKATYSKYRVSTPTTANLSKIGHIVAALDDTHDWAYNSLVSVANFIIREFLQMRTDGIDPAFEPLQTCYSILSQVELEPPKRMITDVQIILPPTIHELKFTPFAPTLPDTLARIIFRMLPFFSYSCDIHRYLVQRRNAGAIHYALQDCDLSKLAHRLAVHLSDPVYERQDSAMLEITIVAGCLYPESVAIGFIDMAFAHESPDFVSRHPVIGAVRYLRRLNQVQEICHQELFYDIFPLFLPRDVDIATAVESLQIHLLNKYIRFLSEFFDNPIPATAKITLSAFDGPIVAFDARLWTVVDPEIQNRFFEAVLAYTRAFSLAAPSQVWSDMAPLQSQLWDSLLFWEVSFPDGRQPRVDAIEPSCLLLLQESLELYHHVGTTLAGDPDISLDTTPSKRLLAQVQKQISSVVPGGDDRNNAPAPNEVEGSLAKPLQPEDVIGEDHNGNRSVATE
ncbi:hypothetical protein MSAN_02480500 [Mycena sanguinolenta]|uniref:DUF6535 domain-containing protein n=1 Tax=Mycena sanguinolenta TaxID=230812 RepID=A0A8H6U3P9_9AGAR|nr:hypothetical protein MSAN_02480500 [Mycena sanguinolenta]